MQVLNLCLTLAFVMFAYVSFAHSRDLVSTDLGRSLLVLVVAVWVLRAMERGDWPLTSRPRRPRASGARGFPPRHVAVGDGRPGWRTRAGGS